MEFFGIFYVQLCRFTNTVEDRRCKYKYNLSLYVLHYYGASKAINLLDGGKSTNTLGPKMRFFY